MPIRILGVSLIHAQIWHERTLRVHLGTGRQLHRISTRGFYGNGQNTQRRPAAAEAPEQTTYMDAILHNVHFPCKPADPHIPMAEDLRDRTLKNVRCYAQYALRDIWHCRSTS